MATRFYITNATSDKALPTVKGTWTDSTAATTGALTTYKAGAAATAAVSSAATSVNFLVARWQSPIIAPTSFTTAQTVQWVVGAVASNTTNSVWVFRVHIFVIEADGSTVRNTLLSNFTGTTVFTTTATGRTDSTQTLANTFSSLAGDRIVVELGYNRTGSATTSKSSTYNYGNTGATDLTSTNTNVTTQPGWFEFSTTIEIDQLVPLMTIPTTR